MQAAAIAVGDEVELDKTRQVKAGGVVSRSVKGESRILAAAVRNEGCIPQCDGEIEQVCLFCLASVTDYQAQLSVKV